jgi:hypothetical protein
VLPLAVVELETPLDVGESTLGSNTDREQLRQLGGAE